LVRVDIDELRQNRYFRLLSRAFRVDVLFVAAAILLTGGLINYLIEGSGIPATTLITRSLRTQSFLETVVYMLSACLGVAGSYMMFRSSQPDRGGRESGMIFISGAMILLVGLFLIFGLWGFKSGA